MTAIHATSFYVDYDDRPIAERHPVVVSRFCDRFPDGGTNEHVLVEFDVVRSSRRMTSEEKQHLPRDVFPAVAITPTAGRGNAQYYRFGGGNQETAAWLELRSAGLVP